ncbi:hypothetical protein ACFH04_26205 [Streptomyces noboritoensis]|uniref:Uncharacterized protein n=1 Tax=Streptomyces noboritoensis TaxID=67337 RepID=A0ABV6TPI7_9ACTN
MRRAALIGVSAAATLALGGTVAACGGEGGKPYVAVGGEAPSGKAVPPHGKVELVPLDGGSAARRDGGGRVPTLPQALNEQGGPPAPSGTNAHSGGGTDSAGAASGGTTTSGAGSATGGGGSAGSGATGGGTGTPGSGSATGGSGGGSASGGSTSGSGSSTGGGGATTGGPGTTGGTGTPGGSPTPAALTLGTPTRTPTPTRRCESVTLPLHNTGGTATTPGTLTFATHVIGLLGVDWATITTTQPLAPVPARTATTRTYTVCVDAWRVPLGMHIETRSVTADWR